MMSFFLIVHFVIIKESGEKRGGYYQIIKNGFYSDHDKNFGVDDVVPFLTYFDLRLIF